MRKIVCFILCSLIAYSPNAFALSIDDVIGFWVSESVQQDGKNNVVEIKNSYIQRESKKRNEFVWSDNGECIILKYPQYKKVSTEAYEKFYDVIRVIDQNKITIEHLAVSGERVQVAYIRSAEKEAKKQREVNPWSQLNLKPTEDPPF